MTPGDQADRAADRGRDGEDAEHEGEHLCGAKTQSMR
jgi:hypothetical protein